MIYCKDSLEYLKTLEDYSVDIIYSDPPYALGSEIIIRPDGKVDYKTANDFMNKWEMPTGEYWEKWFIEAKRVLKHGGYCIMFGMDRQLLLFKYYAQFAGFQEQQSLYWYFISNFPKATDLSKMIDKSLGEEREKIENPLAKKQTGQSGTTGLNDKNAVDFIEPTPSSEIAKKYDGYKYSISPLKQTNETIMVFKKPTKTGSVLHDTLAYENGDLTISVGALNIDGNRVGTETRTQFSGKGSSGDVYHEYPQDNAHFETVEGRYPAQTFIDSQVAEVLDRQSGVLASWSGQNHNTPFNMYGGNSLNKSSTEREGYFKGYNDDSGCSKILHKCDYEQEDYDLYHYEPKVSSSERNAGCDELEEVETLTGLDVRGRMLEREDGTKTLVDRFVKKPTANSHPTLKPIALNEKILKLFKTPNEQVICYPFAGAGSEIIGGIKAGFDNWHGCEISQEYVDIANARIEYWKQEMFTQTSIFDFMD